MGQRGWGRGWRGSLVWLGDAPAAVTSAMYAMTCLWPPAPDDLREEGVGEGGGWLAQPGAPIRLGRVDSDCIHRIVKP